MIDDGLRRLPSDPGQLEAADLLRILIVAYPLIPVRADAPGGTEQVLHTLLRALSAGALADEVELTTVARAGSDVPGKLIASAALNGQPSAQPVDAQFEAIERAQNQQVIELLRSQRFSLVHNQGGGFYRAADEAGLPVLMTLHLARSLYPPDFLEPLPANLRLQCVSRTQHDDYVEHGSAELRHQLVGWIANGIDLAQFTAALDKQDHLVYVGRICYEKGAHLAIELARRARRTLYIIGHVYPFRSHQHYFRESIEPHLGPQVVWLDAPSLTQKRELLAHAAAVVIPSLVDETSSLVAMEAAASGTPVLAFRRGALPEIVRPGETGFLGDTLDDLEAQFSHLSAIAPEHCREVAEREFSAERMAREYLELYQSLAHGR